MMRTSGSILLLAGIALGIFAFLKDTSVTVDGSSIDRVVNLDLMNKKQSLLIVSGILSLMGSIFLGCAHIAQSVNKLKNQNKEIKTLHPSIPDVIPNSKQALIQKQYDKGEISFDEFQSLWNKAKT